MSLRWLGIGLLLAAALLPQPAQALRCDSRVTQPGDHAVQVRDTCGAPFWVDEYRQWQVVGEGSALQQGREHVIEVWYYNFGSNRLMQRLVFVDDRLQGEEELGYGFDRPARGCDVDRLPPGISNGEIVARCGLPLGRRDYHGETITRDLHGNALARTQRREEWTYSAGSSRQQRLLELLDGRLVQVHRLR